MNVLVAVASKHGSTREIARTIAEELRAAGCTADLREVGAVADLGGYDAVVLGSAVYAGNWLSEAKAFVTRQRGQLTAIPVWLFSSGPVGADDPRPHGDPNGLAELLETTQAREHVIFAGKLDKSGLGLGERLISRIVHAPEGDFRDWEAIRDWARAIGAALGVGRIGGATLAAKGP